MTTADLTTADLLVDAFGRIRDLVHHVADGASPSLLTARLDDEANSVGWLLWHLTRIQDDHLAAAASAEQVWTAAGWADRAGLPFEDSATGYGQSATDVAAVTLPAATLVGYHDAVHEQTVRFVRELTDADLSRVVDEAWDPPVTLGVRLVSVLSDDLQHAGQAAFLRGVLERRTG